MKYSIVTITILMLLGGCKEPAVTDTGTETKKNTDTNAVHLVKQTYPPPPLQKKIKLKEVDDTNFDAAYMYPDDTKKKEKIETPVQISSAVTDTMNKEECIAMVTQEKFDKYAVMFGSETASIKRCKMLKRTSL